MVGRDFLELITCGCEDDLIAESENGIPKTRVGFQVTAAIGIENINPFTPDHDLWSMFPDLAQAREAVKKGVEILVFELCAHSVPLLVV